MSEFEATNVASSHDDEASSADARAISAEFLSALMSLIPDSAVVVDSKGLIVSVNEHAEALFGYPPGSLAGRAVETLVPERVRPRHRTHRSAFVAEPMVRPMGVGLDLAGRRRDGSEFPLDISLAPIVNAGERLVIAAIRDVTEQRRASAAQAELAAIVQSSSDAIISTTLYGSVTNWNPAAERLLGYPASEILGEHIATLVPDHASAVLEELLEAASQSRYREALTTRWLHQDGSEVEVSVSISPLRHQGSETLGFSLIVRNDSERKKAEDDLRRMLAEEERLQRQHATAAEIRLSLLSGASLDESLTLICQRASELVGAPVTVICAMNAGRVRIVAGVGVATEMLGASLSPGQSFAEEVMNRNEAIEVSRRSEHSWVEVPENLPDGPTYGIPVIVAGSAAAALVFVRPSDARGFDTTARAFAEALGAQAALAFEIERSRRDREQMMLIGDRERIARDLHDHVIQRLFAAGLGLQASLAWVEESKALERISEAVDVLDETIREIRNTIFSLSHQEEIVPPLRSQILDVAQQSSTSLGFPPSLDFTGPVDVSLRSNLNSHVLACVREALSNVVRHAQATEVLVQLKITEGTLLIAVTDNGVGMGTATRSSGLSNLRERARLLNGTFEIADAPGGGTRLEWTVPLGD